MPNDLTLQLRFEAVGVPQTVGEIQQISATVEEIKARNQEAAAVAGLLAEEYDLTEQEVRQVADALAQAEQKAQAFGDVQKQAGAEFLANAARQVTDSLTEATLASAEYDRVLLGLEKRLDSTGGATGQSLEGLIEFADGLGDATLTSEEAVLRASRTLSTFGAISGENFTRTLTLSQDLAESLGGDLESNVRQLAVALEDPVRGLTALRRSGTTFTEEQKNLISSLVESGDQLGAQGVILDEIERQYGGVGLAAAQGLVGSLDTLGENINDVNRILGDEFVPISQAAVNAAAGLINSFIEAPPVVQKVVVSTAALTATLAAAIAALTALKLSQASQTAQAVVAAAAEARNTIASAGNTAATLTLAAAKGILAQATGTATAAQLAQNAALANGAATAGLFVGAAAAVAIAVDSYVSTTAAARETQAATSDVRAALAAVGETSAEVAPELASLFGTEAEQNAAAQVEGLGKVQNSLDLIRGILPGVATAAEASANQSAIAFNDLVGATDEVRLTAAETAIALEKGVTIDPATVAATVAAIDAATAALEAQQPVSQADIDRRDAQAEGLRTYRDRITATTEGVAALTDATGGLADKLKELSGDLGRSQADIKLLNDSAIAAAEEAFAAGETTAEQRQTTLTNLEKAGIEDRLAANQAAARELRELAAAAETSPQAQQEIDAELTKLEQTIAGDRIALARQVSSARKAAEADAAKAAKAAADDTAKAAEAAAKRTAEADKAAAQERAAALKAARDTEQRAAQQGFDDTGRAAATAFADEQRGLAEAFAERQRSADQQFADEQRQAQAAFEDQTRQAQADFDASADNDAEAFEERLQGSKRQFADEQRQAQAAFEQQQRAAEAAFGKQQNAERAAAEERFGDRRAEIERELQLGQADSPEARAELAARFKAEDEAAKVRAAAFEQLEADERAFEEKQRADAEAFAERQRLADEEFKAAQRAADQEFEAAAAAAAKEFEAAQQAARSQFEEQQRIAKTAFDLATQDQDRAFAEQQREADRAFAEQQRAAETAFADERRETERQFKEQQRAADLRTAQEVAAILAEARPAQVQARRLGGPVEAGLPYLVGEEGPELIYPDRAGYVATAAQTSRIFRGQSAYMAPENSSPRGIEQRLDRILKAMSSQRSHIAAGGNTTNIYEATDPVGAAQKMQLAHLRAVIQSGGF